MYEDVKFVQTNDGEMPVEVFSPTLDASYPGLIFFMDVFGFRDELRRMCRRYATAGYAVFLPGLYHRHGNPNFQPPIRKGDGVSDRAMELNAQTSMEMSVADTGALIRQLDQIAPVSVPILGTVGYCMGGRHALACAAANPDMVRAAASLHGGQMINSGPNSADRVIDRINGEVYFGFAKDDPTCPPADQARITDALAQSSTPGRIDMYDADHGWTFPERYCFNEQASERAWENMFHLLRTRLWAEMPS